MASEEVLHRLEEVLHKRTLVRGLINEVGKCTHITWKGKIVAFIFSERAQSCSCSIEISDTYVYIYIYMAVRQPICACSVIRNVGGVKCGPLSKA